MLSLLGLNSCSLGHLQDAVVGHTQCFKLHPRAQKWILKPERLSHVFLLFSSVTPRQRFVWAAAEARGAQGDPRAERRGHRASLRAGRWAGRRLPEESLSPGRGAAHPPRPAGRGGAAVPPEGSRALSAVSRGERRGPAAGAAPPRGPALSAVLNPAAMLLLICPVSAREVPRARCPVRLSGPSAQRSQQASALSRGLYVINTLYPADIGCWLQNQWQILQLSPSEHELSQQHRCFLIASLGSLTLPTWNGSVRVKPATKQELGIHYF